MASEECEPLFGNNSNDGEKQEQDSKCENVFKKKPDKRTSKRRKCIKIEPTSSQVTPSDKDVIAAVEVFHLEGDAYIKELALYYIHNQNIIVYSFKSPFDIECLQPKYKKLIDLQTVYGHHLTWNSGAVRYSALPGILHSVTSVNTVYFFVQPGIVNPLREYTHIDLAKMGCPHPNFLDYDKTVYCTIHQGLQGQCAVQTALRLGQWYNNLSNLSPVDTALPKCETEAKETSTQAKDI